MNEFKTLSHHKYTQLIYVNHLINTKIPTAYFIVIFKVFYTLSVTIQMFQKKYDTTQLLYTY